MAGGLWPRRTRRNRTLASWANTGVSGISAAEGLVANRADAPYQGGRDRDWLKSKCENGPEFVIGGYTDPQGSRVGFGALLLRHYNRDGELVYAGKVGAGFSRETLLSLRDRLAGLERADPAFRRGHLPYRRV